MSWQAYVDTSLVGTGHIDLGAILDINGDSSWAMSADLKLQPQEIKMIAQVVGGDNDKKSHAFSDGLYVAGERYVLTKADDGSLYARRGKVGLVVAKSDKAIVVGHHPENVQAGQATVVVQQLADYLVKQGY